MSNEPAFPSAGSLYRGISIRAYAAIKVMEGEVARDYWPVAEAGNLARKCVAFADALIAELEKGQQ